LLLLLLAGWKMKIEMLMADNHQKKVIANVYKNILLYYRDEMEVV